ncbi:MAG: PilZ domain-containing protein [Bryobacteraceae bacterium]
MQQLHSVSHDLSRTAASLGIPVQLRLVTDGHEFSGQLERVDRGFLKLSMPAALLNDQKIEVALDGCVVRAEVVSCEQQSPGRFAIAVRRVYGPQGATRAEARIPVDLSAVLTSPSYDRMFARVVDMSQSGLGFELPDSVAVGTKVSVHFACGIAFGEVRHCTVASSGVYRAGMRIEEFIVRHSNTGAENKAAPRTPNGAHRSARHSRRKKRCLAFIKKTFCSVTGHEYSWSIDLWDRAILGCTRCGQALDA